MAGFTLRTISTNQSLGLLANIQRNIRYLSVMGTRWDEKLTKQSKAIGIAEAQIDSMYNLYHANAAYAGLDYGKKEFIAFYDKEYPTRRDFLRKFSMNGEIEHVLEVISDETIVYDDSNYFGYPATRNMKEVIKEKKAKEIIDDLNESYKTVYFAFGFNQGHDAWHYLKKFLIDGFLAFEIIYDGEDDQPATKVIGFKELDPISLEPEIRKDEDGKEIRVWVQYRGDSNRQRELLDSNLIYMSWARGNFISRLSYVERLVRSFNMLRTLENSRIIWNVWNAQMRIKLLVPIGTQSEAKARTRLSELRGMYKEELTIDDHSGEVIYNGSPKFNFAKTFIIPTREGVQTEIEGFQPSGYDLSDTNALKYFWTRFVMETKVPASRFSNTMTSEGKSNLFTSSAEGTEREEMSFFYFINRIRSIYQEIILKPTWIQFVIKHPEFKDDQALKGIIGLKYNEENLFKLAKERELAEKGATTISTLSGITEPTVNPDGSPGEEPYFDTKFLVEKYMDFTETDTKLNKKYRDQRKKEIRKLAIAYARIMAAKGEEGVGMGMEGEGGGFGGGGEFGAPVGAAGGDLGGLGDDMGVEAEGEGEEIGTEGGEVPDINI